MAKIRDFPRNPVASKRNLRSARLGRQPKSRVDYANLLAPLTGLMKYRELYKRLVARGDATAALSRSWEDRATGGLESVTILHTAGVLPSPTDIGLEATDSAESFVVSPKIWDGLARHTLGPLTVTWSLSGSRGVGGKLLLPDGITDAIDYTDSGQRVLVIVRPAYAAIQVIGTLTLHVSVTDGYRTVTDSLVATVSGNFAPVDALVDPGTGILPGIEVDGSTVTFFDPMTADVGSGVILSPDTSSGPGMEITVETEPVTVEWDAAVPLEDGAVVSSGPIVVLSDPSFTL